MWSEEDIQSLEAQARQLRRDVVNEVYAGGGRTSRAVRVRGGLVAALYFKSCG